MHCNITVIVLSNKMQSLKYIIYYAFVTVSIYSHKSMVSQIARFICIVINQIFSLDFTRLLCGVDGDPNNALRFVFGLPGSACGSWNFRADIVCSVLQIGVKSIRTTGDLDQSPFYHSPFKNYKR